MRWQFSDSNIQRLYMCNLYYNFTLKMKVFENRDQFKKMGVSEFKTWLSRQKNLDKLDYEHFVSLAYEDKRKCFIDYFQAIYPLCHSILFMELNARPLFCQVSANGWAYQVKTLLSLAQTASLTQNGKVLFFALQNRKQSNSEPEAVEIVASILNSQPKYLNIKSGKPLIAEAIEKNQFEVVIMLCEKGADCSYISQNGNNLLHLLMNKYSKGCEKIILEIRSMLLERNVDEKRKNHSFKKPLDLCPEISKKVQNEAKGVEKKRNRNSTEKSKKGKSEQGWDIIRNKNIEEKVDEQDMVYLKLENKFDEIQIHKEANMIIEKYTQENQRELKRKKVERGNQKEKTFKNRVMTPDELKYYLVEDIMLETELIQEENRSQRTFLNELVQNIQNKIKNQLGAYVQIFGSFATELCLPESDIDMVIIPQTAEDMCNSFRLLENIYHLLEGMKDEVDVAKFIKTASVPIIKIQCTRKYNEKKIDITYQDQNHNGLQSVALIKEYLSIYPYLGSLTFILKKFIYSARLFDPYSGGISSYGLILMIVAYLQNENRERKKYKQKNEQPMISQLLIGFLRFYGFKCNYIGKRICVLKPERARFQMEEKHLESHLEPIYQTVMDMDQIYNNEWQPRAKLVIIDPLNQNNNVGRATHKIRQIRTAFEMAYVCIHTNKQCSHKKTCHSYKRIKENSEPGLRYQGNRRPCCIIRRMMLSANIILIS